MNGELSLSNRQRKRKVDTRRLRKIVLRLLEALPAGRDYELSIALVDAGEMTRINETYLGHAGSTDVITFDYSAKKSAILSGEIIVCLDEAMIQARRFGTEWKTELVRYLIHGVLHLLGHDDKKVPARRRMKLEENRWLRRLDAKF